MYGEKAVNYGVNSDFTSAGGRRGFSNSSSTRSSSFPICRGILMKGRGWPGLRDGGARRVADSGEDIDDDGGAEPSKSGLSTGYS
jgi:hypothetical protein